MSFFKQNSNAKRMNDLSFNITTVSNVNSSGLDSAEVIIRNSKISKTIGITEDDHIHLELVSTQNKIINNYYVEILLIKKALEWLFNDIEEEYHKYVNITVVCSNTYCINALNEWINMWYNTTEDEEEREERPFEHELYTIYNYSRKCKFTVN